MSSDGSSGDPTRVLLQTVIHVLSRDLRALAGEVEAYPSEGALWVRQGEIPNSAGNLALHLIGNLNHFVGTILGSTGFVRDRDREFGATDIPAETILGAIRETEVMIRAVLSGLSPATLWGPYALPPDSMTGASTAEVLTHLCTHLSYHLGQVNYHRRLTAAG